MVGEDFVLSGKGKEYLKDQLQYYFMFTDNRVKLNMEESNLQVNLVHFFYKILFYFVIL